MSIKSSENGISCTTVCLRMTRPASDTRVEAGMTSNMFITFAPMILPRDKFEFFLINAVMVVTS